MSVDVLQEKIRALKNPIIVSFEPTPDVIPRFLTEESPSIVKNRDVFCRGILDALKGMVPGVKFSLPCFLSPGVDGLSLLSALLSYARELGYYVLLDGIPDSWGVAGQELAASVFGDNAVYPCDGAVLNGYCGTDAITPWLPWCKEGKKSLFILTKSPNRSSVEIQDLLFGGRLVHTAMADMIGRWSGEVRSKSGYGSVGAVVGAPYAEVLKTLRAKYSRMFMLVTEIDSHRAGPKGYQNAFDRLGHGAAVCAGDYILNAWNKEDSDGRDYAEQAVAAVERLKKNIGKHITIL